MTEPLQLPPPLEGDISLRTLEDWQDGWITST
ncbi:phage tail protein I [Escherichia coli]|nr:phage tail protein I [Escherichia coli]